MAATLNERGRVLRSSFILYCGLCFNYGVSMLFWILASRLDVASTGKALLITALSYIFSFFSLFGIHYSIQKRLSSGLRENPLPSAFAFTSIISALTALSVVIFFTPIELAFITVLSAIGYERLRILDRVLLAYYDTVSIVVAYVISAITLISSFIVLKYLVSPLYAMLLSQLFCQISLLVTFGYYAFKKVGNFPKTSKLYPYVCEGIYLWAFEFMFSSSYWLANFFAMFVSSSDELAGIGIILRISYIVYIFSVTIAHVSLTGFARKKLKMDILQNAVLYAIPPSIILSMYVEDLLGVFSINASNLVLPSILIFTSILFTPFVVIPQMRLFASGKAREAFIIGFSMAFSRIFSYILLGLRIGLVGIAFSHFLGSMISTIISSRYASFKTLLEPSFLKVMGLAIAISFFAYILPFELGIFILPAMLILLYVWKGYVVIPLPS